jgi:hypothetical protein
MGPGKQPECKAAQDHVERRVWDVDLVGVHLLYLGMVPPCALHVCSSLSEHVGGQINAHHPSAWPDARRRREQHGASPCGHVQDVCPWSDLRQGH